MDTNFIADQHRPVGHGELEQTQYMQNHCICIMNESIKKGIGLQTFTCT